MFIMTMVMTGGGIYFLQSVTVIETDMADVTCDMYFVDFLKIYKL